MLKPGIFCRAASLTQQVRWGLGSGLNTAQADRTLDRNTGTGAAAGKPITKRRTLKKVGQVGAVGAVGTAISLQA